MIVNKGQIAFEYLARYTKGRGIDVSNKPFFRCASRRCSKEPDNFYTLKEHAVESTDFILCDELIQQTKYHRILIKEFFYALKVGGYLIIRYVPKSLSLEELEKEITFLMKDSIEIEAVYMEEPVCAIIVKKLRPNPSKPEGINYWSCGILTRGTTDPLVDEIIDTIKMQKIPHYEVIVCGKYNGKYKKEVVYIEFMQKDDKGWITKKKNLVCEKARYENILVVHDRVKLDKGWFEGMKKYGNNFEVLSMVNLKDGERTHDWISKKYPLEDRRSKWFLGGYLEYSDWDKWVYIDGGFIILKKYVWEKVKWDETRYWIECEDGKLSNDQTRHGFLTRFNPYSSSTSVRFGHVSSKLMVKKNPKRYGRLKGPIYLIIGKYLRAYAFGLLFIIREWLNKDKHGYQHYKVK